MAKLSLGYRLKCPHSYATEDTPDLLCSFDGKCDGGVYECCMWDMDDETLTEVMKDEQDE